MAEESATISENVQLPVVACLVAMWPAAKRADLDDVLVARFLGQPGVWCVIVELAGGGRWGDATL